MMDIDRLFGALYKANIDVTRGGRQHRDKLVVRSARLPQIVRAVPSDLAIATRKYAPGFIIVELLGKRDELEPVRSDDHQIADYPAEEP